MVLQGSQAQFHSAKQIANSWILHSAAAAACAKQKILWQLHTCEARSRLASDGHSQELATQSHRKLHWFQRQDKECGGLYGVLPLCVGMPVRAADHVDRKGEMLARQRASGHRRMERGQETSSKWQPPSFKTAFHTPKWHASGGWNWLAACSL